MPTEPSFDVTVTSDVDPGERVIVGIADIGVAGLTAVDYLTTHVETEQIGHVTSHNLPDITPVSDGTPRRPIRLYSTLDSDLTVILSEVFLPVWAADPVTEALFDWISTNDLREITVLYGAPFPHSEEEHVVFHVGTDAYREKHFAHEDPGIEPLPGGFFDGVVGELITRGLDTDSPPVGALVTPSHVPGPDIDGALRLIDGLESVYDIHVDEAELKERSEEMKQYYEELAQRMESFRGGDQSIGNQDFPHDRMFM